MRSEMVPVHPYFPGLDSDEPVKRGRVRSPYTPSDVESLRAAIDQDQHETAEKPGPRTRDWLGRMTMAAARGAGYVGGGATATVIGTAVAKYFGLI
jgi:hypothetical protein